MNPPYGSQALGQGIKVIHLLRSLYGLKKEKKGGNGFSPSRPNSIVILYKHPKRGKGRKKRGGLVWCWQTLVMKKACLSRALECMTLVFKEGKGENHASRYQSNLKTVTWKIWLEKEKDRRLGTTENKGDSTLGGGGKKGEKGHQSLLY